MSRVAPALAMLAALLVGTPIAVSPAAQGPDARAPALQGLDARAPTARDRGPAPISLEVMTFNIRTAIGRDGPNVWPNRKELVAETIRRVDPDVLGLQEALAEQIEYLAEALPEYRWLGVDRGLNGGVELSEATPIFYRYRDVVPIESGTFWLSGDPDVPSGRRRAGRIVTWARFHHVETGRQFYTYNTHFTLRTGPRQIEAMERINAHIAGQRALADAEARPVVVMGDFNAVAEASDTWATATSDGLGDAWMLAARRQGPALTSNGFYPPPPEPRERRIDWILVGGPVTVESAETVIHSAAGRFPSDHYPVAATLTLGER